MNFRTNGILLILLLLAISCNKKQSGNGKVTIVKQWHLLASQNTEDIEKSKLLPQYTNQSSVYKLVSEKVKAKKTKLIISEGCEGEINQNFEKTFNGWNYQNLNLKLNQSNWTDILTLIPLKLEVQYKQQLKTLCGDNYQLIQENGLAFSDLRAFSGYLIRLVQYHQVDQKKYELYSAVMFENVPENERRNPIVYARNKSLEAVNRVEKYIKLRNKGFLEIAKENIKDNPVIIIGGLHADDLILQLQKYGINYEVITPKGYHSTDEKLLKQVKDILAKAQ